MTFTAAGTTAWTAAAASSRAPRRAARRRAAAAAAAAVSRAARDADHHPAHDHGAHGRDDAVVRRPVRGRRPPAAQRDGRRVDRRGAGALDALPVQALRLHGRDRRQGVGRRGERRGRRARGDAAARMRARLGHAREYQGELHIQAYDVRAIRRRRAHAPPARRDARAPPPRERAVRAAARRRARRDGPGGGFGGGVSAAAPAYGAPAQMAANGMEPVQTRCRAFEQHGAGDEGAHVSTSSPRRGPRRGTVRGAIEFLAAEGHRARPSTSHW